MDSAQRAAIARARVADAARRSALPPLPSAHGVPRAYCRVKPVYYMRPRSYSLSLTRPPFLMSYSGVLFRRYPEQWQSLLDRGTGKKYRQVTPAATPHPPPSFAPSPTPARTLACALALRSRCRRFARRWAPSRRS